MDAWFGPLFSCGLMFYQKHIQGVCCVFISFLALIKLMNTGRHVRERHKNKELIYSHLLSWAAFKNFWQEDIQLYTFSFSIYITTPLLSVSSLYTPPISSWTIICLLSPLHCCIPFSESTPCPSLTFIKMSPNSLCLEWLKAKCTLVRQWLTTVQMWGRIKKLGDRCSELIVQLQTESRPHDTAKH